MSVANHLTLHYAGGTGRGVSESAMHEPQADSTLSRAGCATFVAVAVAFLAVALMVGHMCDRSSVWLEWPIGLAGTVAAAIWTYRAPTLTVRWLRSLLALGLAVMAVVVYETCLHAEAFPAFLLTGQSQRRGVDVKP